MLDATALDAGLPRDPALWDFVWLGWLPASSPIWGAWWGGTGVVHTHADVGGVRGLGRFTDEAHRRVLGAHCYAVSRPGARRLVYRLLSRSLCRFGQ